jgi:hypothetical protein
LTPLDNFVRLGSPRGEFTPLLLQEDSEMQSKYCVFSLPLALALLAVIRGRRRQLSAGSLQSCAEVEVDKEVAADDGGAVKGSRSLFRE